MIGSSKAEAIDTIARTLWGEARNQGERGMRAVACVIQNRVRNPAWWGKDWIGVCRRKWQFSCWNATDPNLKLLLKVTRQTKAFKQALLIAEEAVDGMLVDITGGADHYLNPKAVTKMPAWSLNREPVRVIGAHHFYRIGP